MNLVLNVVLAGIGLTETIAGVEYNFLFWVGAVVILVGILAVFVVPKFLDNALGLVTIIGFLLLAGTVMVATQFVDLSSLSQASPSRIPEQLRILNVTESSFTVSWRTEEPVVGAVKYGVLSNELVQVAVALDPTEARKEHLVLVDGLQSGTVYYVRIISGGEEFPEDGPMEVRTR